MGRLNVCYSKDGVLSSRTECGFYIFASTPVTSDLGKVTCAHCNLALEEEDK
ncbi:hypothetical protein LCGC14_0775520 [marine sediment metagenome]|uniref:Uncharacterized protein n=1 Tax=marine sediment metagenome TaxID=412755 RepID=A0A0F9QH14_9ZZZZ